MTRQLLLADALFDGTRVLSPARVLIEAGRIVDTAWVGDPPPGTAEVDLRGTTLIPGLRDAHVHLALAGGMFPPEGPGEIRRVALANLAVAAGSGVTLVRDCGSPGLEILRLRDEGAEGLPRIEAAGPALTTPGGHAVSLGREASGPAGLRRAVAEVAAAGADFVKLVGSGGGTPGTDPERPAFSADELRAATSAATAYGLDITMHALNGHALRRGLEAGVRDFQHGWFEPGDSAFAGLPDRLAEAGAVVCPTVWAIAHRIPILRRRIAEWPDDAAARAELDGVQRLTERVQRCVRLLHGAGVRIVAGTDAGWREVGFGEVAEEVMLLAECGLSAQEALGCATGTVKPGEPADLVAVDGDPLRDLGALRRVHSVVRAGTRAELGVERKP